MSQAARISLSAQVNGLRQLGAEQQDPVRFRYLASLATRLEAKHLAHTPQGQRLAAAIATFRASLDESSTGATETLSDASIASEAERVPEERPRSRLRCLLDQLEQTDAGPDTMAAPESTPQPGASSPPRPLRALVQARTDLQRRQRQARIHRAIDEVPEEAGPMNAHRLVSRALRELQRISPAYLDRFVSYTDTLMALERLANRKT